MSKIGTEEMINGVRSLVARARGGDLKQDVNVLHAIIARLKAADELARAVKKLGRVAYCYSPGSERVEFIRADYSELCKALKAYEEAS